MRLACKCGHLHVVQWLWGLFSSHLPVSSECHYHPSSNNIFGSLSTPLEMLCYACARGDFAMCTWIKQTILPYVSTIADPWIKELMINCLCVSGSPQLASWVLQQFANSSASTTPLPPTMQRMCVDVLLECCHRGQLYSAKWLCRHFALSDYKSAMCAVEVGTPPEAPLLLFDDGVLGMALAACCSNGFLEMCQWLKEEFSLEGKHARYMYNKPLRCACECNFLEVAQWLADTFHLTAEDARTQDNDCLLMACRKGNLAVARWLTEKFGLTVHDLRSRNDFALWWVQAGAHRHVASWIESTYGITFRDQQRHWAGITSASMTL
ncbi:hypothetical protein Pelo_13689 [Pelomyxa schiedti]|nr:hypothetical protein Pelo_13689 [Pelomyxa schiedti]